MAPLPGLCNIYIYTYIPGSGAVYVYVYIYIYIYLYAIIVPRYIIMPSAESHPCACRGGCCSYACRARVIFWAAGVARVS